MDFDKPLAKKRSLAKLRIAKKSKERSPDMRTAREGDYRFTVPPIYSVTR
jgi:hypothetical protein